MPNEQEMQEIGKGSISSIPDYRTVKVEHLAGAAPDVETFPASFHIDFSMVPDLYQRKIGACTNHAFAEIYMHRMARFGKPIVASPRFTYTLSKIEDKIADQAEQGTFINMPFKMAVKYGVASETTIPNDTTLAYVDYIYGRDVRNMPDAAFDEARGNKIPGYAQVGSFNAISESQLKQALIHGLDGVAIDLEVGSEWWTSASGVVSWKSADILPIRKTVSPVSGHVITATGWETEAGTGRCKIYFRNHWSKDWADGDNGWFYLDEHQLKEGWIISEIPDSLLSIIKSLPMQQDFNHNFATDLPVGAQSPEVTQLQIALKIVGTFPFNQPVSTYFGNITKAAVMDFQREYKVASEADIVAAGGKLGPKTRETLNKIFAK